MPARSRRSPPTGGGRGRGSPRSERPSDPALSNSDEVAALADQEPVGSQTPLLDGLTEETERSAGPSTRYLIQPGDTLSSIAAAYGVTVEELARVNGIRDPDRIRAGRTLTIPSAQAPEPPAPEVSPSTWVVQSGDSLWALSRRFGVSIDALVRANGIRDPDRIRAGQVLVIPGGGPARPMPRPQAPEPPTPEAPTPQPQAPTPTPQAPTPQGPTPQPQGPTPQPQGPVNQPLPPGQVDAALTPAITAVLGLVPADQRSYAASTVPQILRSCVERGVRLVDQVAYLLATAQHESRFGKPLYSRSESMVEDHNPYSEQANGLWSAKVHTSGRTVTAGSQQELDVRYWDAAYGGRLENRPGTADAANYRGRGLVQLTGRTNYQKMTERLNRDGFEYTLDGETWGGQGNPIDLLAHPDHVNRCPELAAEILVVGSSEGMFTGKALGDYIDGQGTDFYDARAVINGDKERNGHAVAEMAQRYARALGPHWPALFPVA